MHGKCTKPSCDSWHYPECQYYVKPSGCRFGDKCAVMHQQTDGQTCDKPEQQSDEGAVAFLKNSRLLRCVFQDVEPPKFSSILQKSAAVSRPAHTVQFSTNTLLHVKIWENQGLSLGVIQGTSPHERSPYAPKFEDRSQEETEWQERCARGDAWRMAKASQSSKKRSKSLLTYGGLLCSSDIRDKTRGKRIRGIFRSMNAHVEPKGSEFDWKQ